MTSTASKAPQRADARKNIEKITRAAVECLGRDPDASLGQIAQTAGIGRVTLYGHFPSRELLVEAALVRALADGDEVLETVDLTCEPRQALRSLIEASWQLTAQASTILQAAQATMSPARIHDLHAKPEQRVNDLIRRGQAEGAFRTDLPADWLASTMHHVMKGAAADITAARLDRSNAAHFIAEVILSAYAPPTNQGD
ncbi:TetR/AcrR family transcriptional regulator [Agromyces laixinhei]|uniref:TetR/AcrR family transcriptional regulator n=1 Tax=Agromyces laixinhei TaxID=2585717 RepID=UPI0012ED39A2|nr:TetR/AcrR family transcriptional regulator [Agromyces laixinhei]